MAMVTTDAAGAAATAIEKPADTEKPDYVPYNGNSTADGSGGARTRSSGVVDSVVARWRRCLSFRSSLRSHARRRVNQSSQRSIGVQ